MFLINKTITLKLILVSLFLFCSGAPFAFGTTPIDSSQLLVKIRAHNMPFKDAISDIEQQTGYSIEFDNALSEVLITGDYYDIPFDKFLKRVLRKTNYSLIVNQNEKEIQVNSFGLKSYDKKLNSSKVADKRAKAGINLEDFDSMKETVVTQDYTQFDVVSGMSNEAIANLHERQRANYKRLSKEFKDIDVMTGMTKDAIEDLHAKQRANSGYIAK